MEIDKLERKNGDVSNGDLNLNKGSNIEEPIEVE